jgi:hypothetical protein
MKLASSAAFGLILSLGMLSVAAPSMAQDAAKPAKEKKAKPGKAPKAAPFSKEFQPVIMAVDKAFKEKKNDEVLTLLADGAAKAQNPTEAHWVERYRMMAHGAKNDKASQKKALYAMLATGGVPAADIGLFNFYGGAFAYEDNQFADAVRYYSASEAAGYVGQDYLVNFANAYFQTGNFELGSTTLTRAIKAEAAAGKKAPENWYRVAISQAAKTKNNAGISTWLNSYVVAYPTPKVWNLALAIYRDSAKIDPQIQLDVFRLMRDTGALAGAQDYFDYAAVSTERGLPGEAKIILDEGFAKGAISKTTRQLQERLNDAEAKIPADKSSLPGLEKRAAGEADGRLAANTGNAFLAYGENAKALALYDIAIQKKGSFDMNALNLRRGIVLSRLGRKEEAKASFQSVTGLQKELASFWLLYLSLKP